MKFSLAILLSVLAHALLALALGFGAWGLFESDALTLAQLDLSSVELSFAEKEDDAAPVAPSLASAASDPVPETKPEKTPPPPELEPVRELPPEPDAVELPVPDEARVTMETPEAQETPEPQKPEEPPKEEPKEPPRPASVATAAVAPRQARVDAPVRPKKAIKPDYPKGARQRGEQGDVVLELEVNAAGRVEGVRVVRSSGFSELDDAAVRAARAARFTPAKRGRVAVASTARLTLEFRLKP